MEAEEIKKQINKGWKVYFAELCVIVPTATLTFSLANSITWLYAVGAGFFVGGLFILAEAAEKTVE